MVSILSNIFLNLFLIRMVIIIFYQTQWIWRFLGFFLPAIPAVKIAIGVWIMLPQFKGEFFLYHFMLEYILLAERFLLSKRSAVCSVLVNFFTSVHIGALKVSLSYISEECIVKALGQAQDAERLLKTEISCRCDNDGVPEVYDFDPDAARPDPASM